MPPCCLCSPLTVFPQIPLDAPTPFKLRSLPWLGRLIAFVILFFLGVARAFPKLKGRAAEKSASRPFFLKELQDSFFFAPIYPAVFVSETRRSHLLAQEIQSLRSQYKIREDRRQHCQNHRMGPFRKRSNQRLQQQYNSPWSRSKLLVGRAN